MTRDCQRLYPTPLFWPENGKPAKAQLTGRSCWPGPKSPHSRSPAVNNSVLPESAPSKRPYRLFTAALLVAHQVTACNAPRSLECLSGTVACTSDPAAMRAALPLQKNLHHTVQGWGSKFPAEQLGQSTPISTKASPPLNSPALHGQASVRR